MVGRKKTITVTKKPPQPTEPKAPKAARSVSVPEDGIGLRIKEAREAKGISQTVLANQTKIVDPKHEGISRTVIIGYEAGTYKPGAREIRILCEALGVSPNWLLYRSESPVRTTQPSLLFMERGDDMDASIQLAMAILLLKPNERSLLQGLVLSLAGGKVGDLRLSSVLLTSTLIAETVRSALEEKWGLKPGMAASEWVSTLEDQFATNAGNRLKFDEEGNVVGGQYLYPDRNQD